METRRFSSSQYTNFLFLPPFSSVKIAFLPKTILSQKKPITPPPSPSEVTITPKPATQPPPNHSSNPLPSRKQPRPEPDSTPGGGGALRHRYCNPHFHPLFSQKLILEPRGSASLVIQRGFFQSRMAQWLARGEWERWGWGWLIGEMVIWGGERGGDVIETGEK